MEKINTDTVGTKAAARFLGCDMSYIRKFIRNKDLPAVRDPDTGHWMVKKEDLKKFKFSDDPRGRKRKALKVKQLSWID